MTLFSKVVANDSSNKKVKGLVKTFRDIFEHFDCLLSILGIIMTVFHLAIIIPAKNFTEFTSVLIGIILSLNLADVLSSFVNNFFISFHHIITLIHVHYPDIFELFF